MAEGSCARGRPAVGVVMPVYNAEKTLAEAIESVLKQTYAGIVLIIVDDGSTDGSSCIIQGYAERDRRIRRLAHHNSGAAYSRNRAIEYALTLQLDFVAFIDADDVWGEDKIALQLKLCELEKDAQIVITDHAPYGSAKRTAPRGGEFRYQVMHGVFDKLCMENFYFNPVSAMIRSDLLRQNHARYAETDRSGEDYGIFLYLAFVNTVFHRVGKTLYFERKLAGSLQRSPTSHYDGARARVRAIKKLLRDFECDLLMTKEKRALLRSAEDRYRSWVVHSARRSMGARLALSQCFQQYREFHAKRFFYRELAKTLLYILLRPLWAVVMRKPGKTLIYRIRS